MKLFLFTVYTLGFVITSYKEYATKKQWPIGNMYSSDLGWIKIVGFISIFTTFIVSFYHANWYEVIVGAILGWLFSGAFVAIFRAHSQWLVLVLLILSFLLLLL